MTLTLKQKEMLIRRDQRLAMDELLTDETIFSIANGILGTRGHFFEGYGNDNDYPQTLINGFYNFFPYHYEENSIQFPQSGQTIVNLPDASTVLIETDQERINLSDARLIALERTFDMGKGLTQRTATYETKRGFRFILKEEKFVSLFAKHLIVTHIEIESVNYEGPLRFTSLLRMPKIKTDKHNDPRVGQAKKHLKLLNRKAYANWASLQAQTVESHFEIEVAITHDIAFEYREIEDGIEALSNINISPNEVFAFTKYQIYNAELTNSEKLTTEALVMSLKSYQDCRSQQMQHARNFFDHTEIDLSDDESLKSLYYSLYQLNSSGGEHERIQIAAKGISGEGYEGHYFWDTEIYMLPYFILNQPEKGRRLLLYRYHHLEEARSEARKLGVNRGVKIPWRTINGTEASPYYPAGSAQIHINSDVAYEVMQYYNATQDEAFMSSYGFEILLETALFLLDYGHFKNDVFHLDVVTGPDEYTAIVNDNYYTNAMAKRHFENVVEYAVHHTSVSDSVFEKVGVKSGIIAEFMNAANKMNLIIDSERQLVAQDATFLDKDDLDLSKVPSDKHPMLLYYHPLFIYRHQILKQSDAVLAMVLLDAQRNQLYRNTFDYYLARTTHDSSLSKCIYGIAAYNLNLEELGLEFFKDSLNIDLTDATRHTRHGLHMANMGGTYLLLIYGLLGLRLEKQLRIAPAYQNHFKEISIGILYQGSKIKIHVKDHVVTVTSDKPIRIRLFDEDILVEGQHSELIKNA